MSAINAGELINLVPTGEEKVPTAILQTERLKVVRLTLPAGKEIPEHQAQGEITVQCLAGRVDFFVKGEPRAMSPGHLLFLEPGEPHALNAIEDSVMLVTLAIIDPSKKITEIDLQ